MNDSQLKIKKTKQIECEVLRLKKYVFWSFLVFSIKWELYFFEFSWLDDYILSILFYVLLSVRARMHFTGQCLGFKPKNLREKLSKVVRSSIFWHKLETFHHTYGLCTCVSYKNTGYFPVLVYYVVQSFLSLFGATSSPNT